MTRPWETLDRVETPDGPLELRRRGERDFLITIRGRVLMTSSAHRSEDELAQLACAALPEAKRPRVLVSGLGMGFTLRAALDALPRDARVIVAELNPVVVDWCRGPLGEITERAVDDPRVSVVVDDVAKVIGEHAAGPADRRLDAVILDMYEGPPAARIPAGDPLYGTTALARTRAALRPGGVFAVWTETPSPVFERGLERAGFRVECHRGGRGGRVHWNYLARLRPRGAA
jgi:spermidine synthase